MGTYKNPHFALRIPRELLDKIRYIAEVNARSTNREIELLIRNYVTEYEKSNGPIEVQSVSPSSKAD